MRDSQTMQTELSFRFREQDFMVDALKALYWVKRKALIVSDLHLGKAGHFRKNGVPVPRQIHVSDMLKLDFLMKKYQPELVVFLGDLFHSDLNDEWNDFICWSVEHSAVRQLLVKGNHDILHQGAYSQTPIHIVEDWQADPFHFTHEPVESDLYNISGHIHPGVRLYGQARQAVTLPCFYFSPKSALLPAFGNFTGSYRIRTGRGDRVFAVVEDAVVELMG